MHERENVRQDTWTGAGIKNKGKTVNTTKELTENQKLVVEIANHYTHASGAIEWSKAYAEHPEYKKQLSGNHYTIAERLRKMGLLAASPMGVKTGKRRYTPRKNKNRLNGNGNHAEEILAEAEKEIPRGRKLAQYRAQADTELRKHFESEVTQRVMAILEDCPHCPRCGRNNGDLFRVAIMSAKLG